MIDWSVVKTRHVDEAIRRHDSGQNRPYHMARSTFLIVGGREYPAKFIRGLAYKIATGHELNPNVDYSGGLETVRFFNKLGFTVKHNGTLVRGEPSANALVDHKTAKASEHQELTSLATERGATRIVTVCVQGQPPDSGKENGQRERLLQEANEKIVSSGWTGIDAVLFPGGFFYLDKPVEGVSFSDRAKTIRKTSFSDTCVEACRVMDATSPGVFTVAGVDTLSDDQFCIAWSREAIEGIGRKIFPTDKESKKPEFVCFCEDYATQRRIIDLPHGRVAVLCACYDVYGCAESPSNRTDRRRYIRTVSDGAGRDCRSLKDACIENFHNLLLESKVDTALGAIHYDPSHYWQIHGIQAGSAALGGGLVVGAAHFSGRLPDRKVNTLSALGIPRRYLTQKPKTEREQKYLQPIDAVAKEDLLIRLFSVP